MAYIEKRRRTDGGISARVKWRLGGTRDGAVQLEVFSAGTDAQNLARAEGFKKMVDAAGQRWPDGWVKGEGFVRPASEADPLTEPPRFVDIGEEYVRQIVDLSPGQRKRYLGHLRVLEVTRIRGSLIFTKPVTAISEADLKDWLIDWDRSLKTKANYHGLIHGVFGYAVKRGWLSANPAVGTAPRMSRVKQSRPELRFLTERELQRAVELAGPYADLLTVAVGTGMRFGELGALWVSDVDLERRTVRINKAWKRNGEDDATDVPGWLAKLLKPKHTMRDHHLGVPKTTKSRRTITISPALFTVLRKRIEGFARIVGQQTRVRTDSAEYKFVMGGLTAGSSLLDLIDATPERYNDLKARGTASTRNPQIFPAMDEARRIIRGKRRGYNILRYLLLRMRNEVLKAQYYWEPNSRLSNLNLGYGCIPFDGSSQLRV